MDKKWFDQLTEAQKEKLRGLNGSLEELAAFCEQEAIDLPDDVMDAVSGGEGHYVNQCPARCDLHAPHDDCQN